MGGPWAVVVAMAALGTGSCYTASMPDRDQVVNLLSLQMDSSPDSRLIAVTEPGADLGPDQGPDQGADQGANLWEGGLSEHEVMGAALGDHPEWMAILLELDVGRMDLLQAGKIGNPLVQLLLPVGSKQFEGTLTSALSDLWLRRDRLQAAELDGRVLAERIMTTGLQRVTAARLAFHRARFSNERAALMAERATLEGARLTLIERAIELGELGELELVVARVDAATADALSVEAIADASVQWNGLLAVIGEAAGSHDVDFDVTDLEAQARPSAASMVSEDLVRQAVVSRHEVRGATLEAAAAGRRAGLARKDFMAMSWMLDANDIGGGGFEIGPGLQLQVPVFDRGDARRGRANADLTLRLAVQRAVAFTVQTQVTQRLEQLRSQELLAAAAERQLVSVEDRFEVAYTSRKIAGEANDLEGQILQRDILSAREKVLAARLARALAFVDLESALGFRIQSVQAP